MSERLASLNGLLWALGSGLLSSQLVIYLAQEFHSAQIGWGIGLILSMPYFVGVLRLAAPAMIGRLGDRKSFCIACFVLSGVILCGVPLLAAVAVRLPAATGLAALVVLWCGYNVFEYLGVVALWSWLADIAPAATRGSFLGRRERWMAAGQAAATLASAGVILLWERAHPGQAKGIGYAVSAGLGAFFVLAAVMPLLMMPAAEASTTDLRPNFFAPLRDGAFLGLLAAGLWFSFTNGLVQAPQGLFPNRVLGLSLSFMLCLRVGLRCGQWPIAPAVGRLADARGNRLVMAASLVLVAAGAHCYALATTGNYAWIVAAWACWIGWVGYNVGLPNLLLKVAPRSVNSSYIALYYAAIGLAHGAGSLWGGFLFDRYGKLTFSLGRGYGAANYYQLAFLFAAVAYLVSASLILVVVREPRKP